MAIKKTWDWWLAAFIVTAFWTPIVLAIIYYVGWRFLIKFVLIENWQFVVAMIAAVIFISIIFAAHARVGRDIALAEDDDNDVA